MYLLLGCLKPVKGNMATRYLFILDHALTSFRALLVHDTVAALSALDGILGLDEVVRSTVFHTVGDDEKIEAACMCNADDRKAS